MIDPNMKIKLKVHTNPCRPGTGHAQRFGLYRDGMRVREYVQLGGHRGDVRYDLKKKFIRIAK